MTQSCSTGIIYASEFEVIRQHFEASRLSGESEANGALYGLWTRSGGIVVQLANASGGPQADMWTSFCGDHRLDRVGSWGNKEPKLQDRPSDLDESLVFVYVCRSPDNDKLICYSIPASAKTSSLQVTELTTLPTRSPFRALKDSDTTILLDPGTKYLQKIPQPHLKRHWSSKERYIDFLTNLQKCFSDTEMEVKQFQDPGSDYIALQVKSREATFAVGFPSDFDKKRKVDVYRDKQDPFVVKLPLDAHKAFDTLVSSLLHNDQLTDKGSREGQIAKKSPVSVTDLQMPPSSTPSLASKTRDKTRRLLNSDVQYLQMNSVSDLTGHWTSKKTYRDFLKDLRTCFSAAEMEVKQFQQPGSDYIALQVKAREATFAVGFPSDFDKKRKVDVYRDKQDPVVLQLALDANEAFSTLLSCL
ncbi:uncharacterized protein LOC134182642 [Corticium candelabrum]|uniref:uncharacterized protein LOC134182642 n=1 Tax=Corticium candelabrum TaxID=121492 RepID=UPI002E2586BE|nr:uncharacterized protein LOC134182642 [Corticium candelabrum]